MKIFFPVFLTIGLGACSMGPTSNIAGITPVKGSELAGLTNTPAQEVATCMGQMLGVPAQSDGEDFILKTVGEAGPLSFRVRTIKDKYDRYSTQIDRTGAEIRGVPATASCISKRPNRIG